MYPGSLFAADSVTITVGIQGYFSLPVNTSDLAVLIPSSLDFCILQYLQIYSVDTDAFWLGV